MTSDPNPTTSSSSNHIHTTTTKTTTDCGGGASYTSLKDILPQTPTLLSGISSTQNSSWHEIPIRNPLVKHAAWAYLQPMSAIPDSDDNRCCLFTELKCCEIGCFEYFRKSILNLFLNRRDADEDGFCGGGGCNVD